MVVKSFRGLLADGAQDRIPLGTIKGKVGYRIIKFQIFPNQPGLTDYEALVQIWKSEQASVPVSGATTNFTDSDLLAANFLIANNDTWGPLHTIFEMEVFNQNIYITHTANTGTAAINYYIELEQFPLASDEATVATLKDIKLNA